MLPGIEIVVCAAVLMAVVLELLPRLAELVDHALFMLYVTVAALPFYLVLTLRQRVLPESAQR